MHTKVTFDPKMPQEVRGMIEPTIMRYLRYIPSWCRDIYLYLQSDVDGPEGTVAVTENDPKYQRAEIYFTAEFLQQTPEEQVETIVHEMMHVVIGSLSDYSLRMLEIARGDADDDVREILESEHEQINEQTVCDLARAIQEK